MSQGDLLLTARENAPITSAEEGSVAISSCAYSSPMYTTSIRMDLFLIMLMGHKAYIMNGLVPQMPLSLNVEQA